MPFCCLNCFKKIKKKNITKFVSKNARNDKIHISLLRPWAGDFFPSIHGLLKLCQRRGHRLDLDFVRSRDDEFCLPICLQIFQTTKKTWEFFGFLFCKKKMTTKKKAGKQKQHKHHKNLEMQSCLKKSRFMKKKRKSYGGRRSLVTSHVFNGFLTLSTATVYSEMVEFWSQNTFLML